MNTILNTINSRGKTKKWLLFHMPWHMLKYIFLRFHGRGKVVFNSQLFEKKKVQCVTLFLWCK